MFKLNTPTHVAIIMDGNRRWAVSHNLPYVEGHKEALKRIEELIEYSANIGVEYLTLWAWSPKNFKRSKDFVSAAMKLFEAELNNESLFDRARKNGVENRHIGSWDGFPKGLARLANKKMSQKVDNPKLVVNWAIGYEGRAEITKAVKEIVSEGIPPKNITQETISEHLYTAGQPDVDFMIRTGGNLRTSGYLIWQIADAELYFTDTFMPDFGVDEYKKALKDYAGRERRFGGDSKKY